MQQVDSTLFLAVAKILPVESYLIAHHILQVTLFSVSPDTGLPDQAQTVLRFGQPPLALYHLRLSRGGGGGNDGSGNGGGGGGWQLPSCRGGDSSPGNAIPQQPRLAAGMDPAGAPDAKDAPAASVVELSAGRPVCADLTLPAGSHLPIVADQGPTLASGGSADCAATRGDRPGDEAPGLAVLFQRAAHVCSLAAQDPVVPADVLFGPDHGRVAAHAAMFSGDLLLAFTAGTASRTLAVLRRVTCCCSSAAKGELRGREQATSVLCCLDAAVHLPVRRSHETLRLMSRLSDAQRATKLSVADPFPSDTPS